MSQKQIRNELAALEQKLYDARTLESERSDLSMQVSILRADYARALRIGLWTATAALETAAGEEEA